MTPSCPVCSGDQFRATPVLWPELIAQWRLTPDEAAYIDRQQGFHCVACGCNLRAMALAAAITRAYGFGGDFRAFTQDPDCRHLRVLELNPAGELTHLLARMPGRVLASFPEVDMTRLPYPDASFDLVVHSDTLEHVPNPVQGLAECRRVLTPAGACAFTVPLIVGRMTASRAGLPPSYHGDPKRPQPDFAVETEYGADIWTHVCRAGFAECRIIPLEYPAAQAILAIA